MGGATCQVMFKYYTIQTLFKCNTRESLEIGIVIRMLQMGNLRLSNIIQLSLKNPWRTLVFGYYLPGDMLNGL